LHLGRFDNFDRLKKGFQMSMQELSAEQLAELFHHYHRALAPDFGSASNSVPGSWDEVSQPEKTRMVAAARLAILEVASRTRGRKDSSSRHFDQHYFANPGDAEWGC
jgi:hypothetical protein